MFQGKEDVDEDFREDLKAVVSMDAVVLPSVKVPNFNVMVKFDRCLYGLYQLHSVEKYHKTRSLFLRKNEHFLRQINVFNK